MIFNNLSGKNKVIYESMWGHEEFSGEGIEVSSGSDSTTYKIAGDSKEACKIIENYYKLSNKELFEYKYKKAVSGNGDEEKKILTLHSSSRCALLCFYNVEEKPIVLNINGENIEFNYSTFEFKNPVIGYPSNMDVVLLSSNRKTVLFLESKFAEYFMSSGEKSAFISNSYKDKKAISKTVYDKIEQVGFEAKNSEKEVTDKNGEKKIQKGFILSSLVGETYPDGIKQMISHYVGIIRRLEKASLSSDKKEENNAITYEVLNTLNSVDSKVYLGEILFDGFVKPDWYEGMGPEEILDNYSRSYEKLATVLNDEIKRYGCAEKFQVLKEDIKYSDVMHVNKTQIDESILRFYKI